MTTAWLTHPSCLLHDMGEGHPECPDRLAAIEDRVVRDPVLSAALRRENAPAATREQIERAHDARLVDAIERATPPSLGLAGNWLRGIGVNHLAASARALAARHAN